MRRVKLKIIHVIFGICKPDELCTNNSINIVINSINIVIKNPVNYPFKKLKMRKEKRKRT
jgi:hypothetical protein